MVNTYTSSWNFAQEYDSTYHTPKDMVGSNTEIVISNVQIQWQGSDAQKTETYTNSYTGEGYGPDTISAGGYESVDTERGKGMPDVSYFDHWDVSASVDYTGSGSVSGTHFFWSGGSSDSIETETFETDGSLYHYANGLTPENAPIAGDFDDRMHYRVEPDSDFQFNNFEIEVTAVGYDDYTAHTKNPEVQGDVSASVNGTLYDGETSSWTSLSGLQPNQQNEFDHRYFEGSEELYYRIKFDWEIALSPPTNLQITDASTEDKLTLDWDTSGTNASGYYVYRAESNGSTKGDYTQVADVSSPPYTDAGLEDGEKYYYRVSSHD